ncbi:DMT family transporter [Albimonas sp. CAU 1670]|uniref:DMT family transporter n=1 Tax=Albimonas sp. CAU 1670 TaxID=3032599 RepID=UPI0023DBDA80|nr:DMT family transporter [Albimonas sp. CAU 1670]MDF2231010.1 DMT family transporter [Albimonas sp. CAU 1670]
MNDAPGASPDPTIDAAPAAAEPKGWLAALDPVAMLMGVGFAIIWSSAFTAAKFVVADAPPFLALSARFAVAGLMACALAAAMGQSAKLTRRQWGLVVVFGLCQNSLYLGLNFLAMTRIDGGLAAIIASTLPLFVAAGAWVFLSERPRKLGAVGLALGFAGVAVVMGARIEGGADPLYVGFALLGALALAVATLLVRGVSPGPNVLMIVGLQMLVGSAGLAPVALAFESVDDVRWTLPMLLGVGYSMIFAGIVATVVWLRLVRRIGPTNAAAFHFLNPCLGLAVAAALLGETLGPRDLVGVAIVTVGILLVQLSRRPA